MIKKIALCILALLIAVLVFFFFIKKDKPKEIIYNGSVMLYSNINEDIIKKVKEDFEATYKGVVLEYFINDSNRLKTKIEESFDIDWPEADIVVCDDLSFFDKLSSSDRLIKYTSIEDKNIIDSYKTVNGAYSNLCYSDRDNYMMGLLSNSLNVDNGKLLADYLLSKKCQEILVNNGLKSIRKDLK